MPDRSNIHDRDNRSDASAGHGRSKLEDRAMAVGLVALGAALPIYEQLSGRLREFHASRPGRVLGATARTAVTLGRLAARGAESLRSRAGTDEADTREDRAA